MSGGRRAVFLDKDGTLVEDVPWNVDPARLVFTPHAGAALRRLADAGWLLVVVTNQPGIAAGRFSAADLEALRDALAARLQHEAGVTLAGFYACPHRPADPGCTCRKPLPGLLRAAAQDHRITLDRSWMIGDILDDVEAGRRAGCRSVLLDRGHETEFKRGPLRRPHHRAADLADAAEHILASSDVPRPGPAVEAAA